MIFLKHKNIMSLFNYIRETIGELKHVNWPSRKQIATYTILVIVISFVVSIYLGVFDRLYTYIITNFFI